MGADGGNLSSILLVLIQYLLVQRSRGGRGCDDSVPGEVSKTAPSGDMDCMILYMVGKLTPK